MKKYSILFIDDDILCVTTFFYRLKKIVPNCNVEIHWALDLYMADKMISQTPLYKFDLVICDIMGTRFESVNISDELKHPNIVITSGVLAPQDPGVVFFIKDELPAGVAKMLPKE